MKLAIKLLEFFLENKKLFLISFISTNIIVASIFTLLDKEYHSQAKILPADKVNNTINFSSLGSFFPTYLKDPRGGQIFSPIIKSKNFYENLSKESVMVDGESISIHSFLLEYYDLKVKEKNRRNKKTTHDFLLDSYNLSNKNKNIELKRAYKLFSKKLVSVRYDQVTGVVTIDVFTKEPMLSQLLAELTVKKLEDRLIEYHIKSKEKNKDFIFNRLNEIETDLRNLEEQYIKFLNSNIRSNTPYFRTEKLRLERQMNGKENLLNRLYSELEINSSEQMRENQTFLDIIESPTLNENHSYPSSSTALLISLLISFSVPFAIRFKRWNN
tara:strand:- start:144 stop:1127 length:984 start_codon:yes stop_codon:yes gene_type:complete